MPVREPTATVQLKLRFDEKLRRRLEQAARKADRSMNSEIIARLEQSFDTPALVETIKNTIKTEIQATARFGGEGGFRDNPNKVYIIGPDKKRKE
jgi:hypothetical protein